MYFDGEQPQAQRRICAVEFELLSTCRSKVEHSVINSHPCNTFFLLILFLNILLRQYIKALLVNRRLISSEYSYLFAYRINSIKYVFLFLHTFIKDE